MTVKENSVVQDNASVVTYAKVVDAVLWTCCLGARLFSQDRENQQYLQDYGVAAGDIRYSADFWLVAIQVAQVSTRTSAAFVDSMTGSQGTRLFRRSIVALRHNVCSFGDITKIRYVSCVWRGFWPARFWFW